MNSREIKYSVNKNILAKLIKMVNTHQINITKIRNEKYNKADLKHAKRSSKRLHMEINSEFKFKCILM